MNMAGNFQTNIPYLTINIMRIMNGFCYPMWSSLLSYEFEKYIYHSIMYYTIVTLRQHLC